MIHPFRLVSGFAIGLGLTTREPDHTGGLHVPGMGSVSLCAAKAESGAPGHAGLRPFFWFFNRCKVRNSFQNDKMARKLYNYDLWIYKLVIKF